MYYVTVFREHRDEFLPEADSVIVYRPGDESWDSLTVDVEVQHRDKVHTILELQYGQDVEYVYLWGINAFTREYYEIE